ncbi:MAG TPA: pyridoxal-dependent decarboxylase [Gemmatimonadales bacterium]|nr:pyridoxal-dependent decarboxylase [Gemmatimonadales bacterium]
MPHPPEESLDPKDPAEWEEFRTLAHRMVDDMVDHLSTLRQRPAWQKTTPQVHTALDQPVPRQGQGMAAAYRDFVEFVRPYPVGNLHPRFWGWVMGNGTPFGMMADMLAAGINANVGGFDQAPALVEEQVHAWLAELMGMPKTTTGLFVTGGSMANVIGLAVGRHAQAARHGFDVRELGMQAQPGRMTCYGSVETHSWARKAVEFLGLGNAAYRKIPVDREYRIDLAALEARVREDRAAGELPFCVIGSAGTVNTGATDDLRALAAFARREGLWFHVDGAFGALARLSPSLRPVVDGIEEADSLAFDLHKWGYLPIECACVLVRDGAAHRAAFATTASYLTASPRGVNPGPMIFADRGLDLSRSFKALKVWLSFKAHGVEKFGRLIEQNVAQARHLAARVTASPDLELLAPVPLNIVCFRYAPRHAPADRLDAINEEILIQLQERGIAVPSGTRIGGRFAIRVANTNHRSRLEDFDALAEAVVEIGRSVAGQGG